MNSNQEKDQKQDNIVQEQIKRKGKKLVRDKSLALAKKGAKLAAKAAAKLLFAITKFLLGLLAGVGTPLLLIIGGIVALIFLIYLATAMIFSNAPEELPPDAFALREYIIEQADKTVDMSNEGQLPYRVPHELIISALQIYDSTKHDSTTKEIAKSMAEILAPIFQYGEYKGEIEEEVTTCVEGECTTVLITTPITLNFLVSVHAWDRIMTRVIEPHTTDWSYASTTTTVYVDIPEDERVEGGPTQKAVQKVSMTKARAHTYNYLENIEIDYSLYDRVLSDKPFEYGQEDKFMVEAIYHATDGEIQYREWLTGDSLIGFDGNIIPGEGVPMEFMEHYLAAEKKYGVDWYYLAAIHFIETAFSTHPSMMSSVGAEGHMQFMPCTWLGWSYPGCKGGLGGAKIPDSIKYSPAQIKKYGGLGVDADGNGVASPWDIKDAIFTAAKYLSNSGFSTNIDKAIRAYNHSDKYVNDVKSAAKRFKEGAQYVPGNGTTPDLAPGSFMRPSIGTLTSPFGQRWGKLHAGVDIADTTKPPVVAIADGVVNRVFTGCPQQGFIGSTCGWGWGNFIIVRFTVQGKTYDGVYAHLSKIGVSMNQKVVQGQYLGNMGNSGSSTGNHLHFELHVGQRAGRDGHTNVVNPALYIPF